MVASVKCLLSSILDYAGLFPPARLDLSTAIANYAQDRLSPYAWILGRFVLPATRLDDLLTRLPDDSSNPWSLSLTVASSGSPNSSSQRSLDWQQTIDQIQTYADSNQIRIAALEFPPLSVNEIAQILPAVPTGVEAFFEIPYGPSFNDYIGVLQQLGGYAKLRTGGITADAFPNFSQLSQSMLTLAAVRLPFKATAGLHHPLPGQYRLTYELDSPNAVMHGFLNVILLAALLYWQKLAAEEALLLLQQPTLEGFQFTEAGIIWQTYPLSCWEISTFRQQFFRSFGSCSFQEPIDHLQKLQLL